MARVTPEEFQEKHARRLKGATEDIRRGVERVTTSPTEKAAAKADKFLAKVTESVNSGKWQSGLRRVTLEEWKGKMIEKGIARIPQGIDGARDKVIAFASDLLPHVDRGVDKVKNMPDLTIEDSINRMTSFVRHMAEFKRR